MGFQHDGVEWSGATDVSQLSSMLVIWRASPLREGAFPLLLQALVEGSLAGIQLGVVGQGNHKDMKRLKRDY